MNQSAILKKKGSIPNKAQSPLKNLDADMQYRSSVELVNTFKIKRENVASERNHKAKKEHVPTTHRRKNSEDLIPQQGKSKLFGRKSVIQSSSREELSTSHMIAGKGQNKPRLFQSGESIQEKGIKLPMHNFVFQTPPKKGVTASVHVTGTTLGNGEEQHNNQDLLSFKQVKRKLVLPATSVDQFLKKQQIHKEHDIDHDLPNKKEYMPAPSIHEHTKGLDDLEGQEEIGEDECDIGEEVDTDCSTKGISRRKSSRTNNMNPRFINLMYTSWHRVPKDIKKRMWEYINSKFLIPIEGKKWVMTGLRDAWRLTQTKMKERIFDKSKILKNNKWRHRMGPINFARVQPVALRATKENNEEPSQSEMFIATRIKDGKEIQPYQSCNRTVCSEGSELRNRQNSGNKWMMPLGRVWKGAADLVLEKDEETNKLKQKHANEIGSLKEEMNEMREEMRYFFSRLPQNNPGLNVQDIPWVVGSNLVSPVDASSASRKRPKYSTFFVFNS
ncbi:hypothetical protein H5410_049746 [Solanum commersonii]|uniref:Uncharacterized protein n=1 Tax=Solanum commersonii TaxID=4109 RepID=A0A9J5WUY1_SOLCO|nr:hypothetical protein H5410_049746 [Solanum commersonii]